MSRVSTAQGGTLRSNRHYRSLPTGVWAMGFGSLLMDTSSELIHSVLPVFMASVLGASMATIGIIEGAAEATASLTKVFSGSISDRIRKRKPLFLLGYGLAAATKPVFPLATSVAWVAGARWVDRLGKGIRGAPRDALIADLVAPAQRGAAFGLRQALDSVGAFLGPLLALIALSWLGWDLAPVLWIAVVPAIGAVVVLAIWVEEPSPAAAPDGSAAPARNVRAHDAARRNAFREPWMLRQAGRLPREFWLVVILAAALTLARFSEAFLVLRARDLGLGLAEIPLVMIVMNVVFAGFAYPAGAAADRVRRSTLLFLGLGVLVVSDLVLAFAPGTTLALMGAGLWGLHMALTQGLLSKIVADAAPPELRGTAFGLYNLVTGVSLLLASSIAGILWTRVGPQATFLAGAGFAALAMVALLVHRAAGRLGRIRG